METEEELVRSVVSKKEKKLAAQWAREIDQIDADDDGRWCDSGKQTKGGKDNRKGKGKQQGSGDGFIFNEDYEESEEKHLLKFQEYLSRNPEHVFR